MGRTVFTDKIMNLSYDLFRDRADSNYAEAHEALEEYKKKNPKPKKNDVWLRILQDREAGALIQKTIMHMTPEQSKSYFESLEREEELAELKRLKEKYEKEKENV